MIGIALHEAFDVEDVAGEHQTTSSSTSSKGGIRPIIHLIEPIGGIWKFSLKFWTI